MQAAFRLLGAERPRARYDGGAVSRLVNTIQERSFVEQTRDCSLAERSTAGFEVVAGSRAQN